MESLSQPIDAEYCLTFVNVNFQIMKRIICLAVIAAGLTWGCAKDDFPLPDPNNLAVGASAGDLLGSAKYSKMEIQIHYMTGFKLTDGTITNLTDLLNSTINKPGGITITQIEIPAGATASYSLTQVKELESQHRTSFTRDNIISVHVLIVNGDYSQNGVIGVAYRNTSLCLFGKTIHENSGGVFQVSRTKLETTVLHHEFGHIFGLVNIGSAMQTNHEDGGHKGHCNNSDCLMYYSVNTTEFLGTLLSGPIPAFDQNCKNDMTANGGQ
jgi:hypothetical protein